MNPIPDEPKRLGFRGRPGNPQNCQKCLAKTRRGTLCQKPAERNVRTGKRKRCRLHGAKATGPRTPEGLARVIAASWKHGRRSKAYLQAKKALARRLEALEARKRGT